MQLKVVFDANVYIAAAVKPGGYADTWLDIAALPYTGLNLFLSQPILGEVREKLVEEFGLPSVDVDLFIDRLEQVATVVKPAKKINGVKNDPDDNMILECAIAAGAHLIISADNHLLSLNPYKGIGIAHPREVKNIFASDRKDRPKPLQ